MEASSGVKFTKAQVVLAHLLVGDSADPDMPTKVMVKVPKPTAEGIVLSDKAQVQTDKYPLPRSYREAESVIKHFEQGAEVLVGRRHEAIADSVVQHALQDKTELADKQWLGSEGVELNLCVLF